MEAFLKAANPNLKLSKEPKPSTSTTKRERVVPWVEKYRPKTVDDVASQEEVVSVLKKCLQGADLPNLLFYGPPGTGKTSTILALARELFGDMYKNRILELNASDERGIQVVREKVKTFSQLTANSTGSGGKSCPPYKIVILDEADSMTSNAQAALRRVMEKQTKTTRFCLICNYVSRIIEPLTSRCSKFRFKPLPSAILLKRLRAICDAENVNCSDAVLTTLMDVCEGDMRRAVTLLQSAHAQCDGEVTSRDVAEVAGVVPSDWMNKLWGVATRQDGGVSFDKMQNFVEALCMEGYAASQVLSQLFDRIVSEEGLTDGQKSKICEKLAICEHRLMDGADEYLQLLDLCATISYVILTDS